MASPLTPPSDAELVAAARAGDMEAFACLVGRHRARAGRSRSTPVPSDALNLAVVSGASVRVNAAVLSDPQVEAHLEWERYPVRIPDLAAEERQRRT
ncbi:MAG TPA: hypothetical protein VGS06_13470, partial [Streptosporangiaceae bacterium]|nr:hypothetical protein [Streptosporangiaceae bacterium]